MMTFKQLKNIITDNDIPEDVHLVSDSGWECCATDMDGVYYNQTENTIVFTQGFSDEITYSDNPEWKCLHKEEE